MSWLTTSWYELLGEPAAHVSLALVATVAGAFVGLEREKRDKPAGMRTMALVSLGAAAFTMVSFAVAGEWGDRGRIAGQIVSGIGFLGAGAILRGPVGVVGLTTAATIWAVASIGMVIGAGYAGAGLALSLGILGIQTWVVRLERRYLGPCKLTTAAVVFDSLDGKALVKIDDILDDYRIPTSSRRVEPGQGERQQLSVTYCNAHRHHRELLTRLASLPEVRDVRREAHD